MILCLVCFEKGPLDCSEIAREKKKEESQSQSQSQKFRTFLNRIFKGTLNEK